MLQIKRTLGACILAIALLPNVATHAATYYVATTGNNGNPGTSSLPWRTVAYATSKMVAGDTTYVKGGVYNEGLIRFGRSGTSSAPIKLLNAPGTFPVIDCINKANRQMVLLQNSSGSKNPIGWITIEGFEIRDCYHGIKFYNLHDSVIRRNWIHHNTLASGIYGNGTRILFDRNKINSNGSSTTGNHGLYANGSHFTVTNNLFYDNQKYGIQLNGTFAYNPATSPGPEFVHSYNWTIANNTFAYQRQAPGMVVWGSTCNNARIENNIFYENGVKSHSYSTNGINFISPGCKGVVIRNNLAYASGAGATFFIAGGTQGVHYTQSGNIVNTLNPKFVNAPATLPSSPNFSLVSGSAAIDKGVSLSVTKISYSGTIRPKLSAYDIGAYEYYGISSLLATPTSLQNAN